MPEEVIGDIGGVSASIWVPQGSDPFDVPRDTKRMAADTLAAIAAKPAGTRTWRHHHQSTWNLTLGNPDQWYGVSDLAVAPAMNAECFAFLRLNHVIEASDIGGNEGPDGAWVRCRFYREHGAAPAYTAATDFFIPANGIWHFSTITAWDNTGAGSIAGGANYAAQMKRSNYWTCKSLERTFDVFYVARSNADAGVRNAQAEETVTERPMPVPQTYTKIGAGGVVERYVTDLGWLNRREAVLPDHGPAGTPTGTDAPTFPATLSAASTAQSAPIVLGDGSRAVWNGSAWVTAP